MVAAIAAGFEVIAIDAFADVDTKRFAQQVIAVKQTNGNFDTADFLNKIQSIALDSCLGLVYGSGFEGNVELLTELAKQLPIIGNMPQTVAQIKSPADFFKVLDDLNITHPEVCFGQLGNVIDNASGWLLKRAGGAGGMHIQKAVVDTSLAKGEYFQSEIIAKINNSKLSVNSLRAVTPVSLLFLGNGKAAQLIGFNQQLLAATEGHPCRYGGVVSHYPLAKSTQQVLLDAADKLTKHYALRGLNSLDVMVEEGALGEQVWVLEINPRLSASVGLYQFENANLVDLHIEACTRLEGLGDSVFLPKAFEESRAHGIFYAPFDFCIKQDITWPTWVVDTPQPNTYVKKDEPVCTVIADGVSCELAYQQLLTRLELLHTECLLTVVKAIV